MSRIGKKGITIPSGTTVTKNGDEVIVKGPLGEIKRTFLDDITISIEGNLVTLVPAKENNFTKALWGTYASHITNMVKGVSTAFEKKLILEGVGFKSEVAGNSLNLALGFSHPVKVEIPKGLTVVAEKNNIKITGIDKEQVGQFASKIRSMKKPEPYKGKGFRYFDEVLRRKQGKKSA